MKWKLKENALLTALQGSSSKQTSIETHSNQDSLVPFSPRTGFFDDDWFKWRTTERKASRKTQETEKQSGSHLLIFINTSSLPPSPPSSALLSASLRLIRCADKLGNSSPKNITVFTLRTMTPYCEGTLKTQRTRSVFVNGGPADSLDSLD